jgi:hypothetical protein
MKMAFESEDFKPIVPKRFEDTKEVIINCK